mmetsp:Transcript_33652/g.87284  ORF Transcript_33652/g.87284 Transcript_33652/m.87284 type:complete len:302 (+) Transcript_33652:110-1015(+)
MLLLLSEALAPGLTEKRRAVAAVLSGVAVQLALPAAVTADLSVNQFVLTCVWLLFQAAHYISRDLRVKLLEGLRSEAKRVDPRLEVSECLVFSQPEVQAAYEGWNGHRMLDWMPNMMALVANAGIAVKMRQRAEICPLDMQLFAVLFVVLCLSRCIATVWRRLSFSQRAWLSIGLGFTSQWYTVAQLMTGNTCYISMLQDTGTSLPGMVAMLAILCTMAFIVYSVTAAYTEMHYGASAAGFVAILVVQRMVRTGTSPITSAAARREVAVLLLLAAVIAQVGCTGRYIVAKYNMMLFLARQG